MADSHIDTVERAGGVALRTRAPGSRPAGAPAPTTLEICTRAGLQPSPCEGSGPAHRVVLERL